MRVVKKNARQWAQKIEGDADLIALYGSDGATVTFTALADEQDKWWSPNHNSKSLNARLGFWRDLYGSERVVEITPGSIRSALTTYRKSHSPASTNRLRYCLSSVFSFAIKQRGYVTTNPVLQVRRRIPVHDHPSGKHFPMERCFLFFQNRVQ